MAHIDGPSDAWGDWAAELGAFIAHWKGLRDGAFTPASEAFLDHPAPQFAANTYIVEMTTAGAMVRYQGADLVERWMRDFTGHELHEGRLPEFKKRSLSNMSYVVDQPCGYLLRLSFSTSTGRKMSSDLVQLPLAVSPGKPRRVVCYSHLHEGPVWQETVAKYLETHRSTWLDLGAGVPGEPPQALLQDK